MCVRLGGRTIGSTSDSGSDYPGSSPGLPANFFRLRWFESRPPSQLSPRDLHAPTKIYCHAPTGLRIWTFSCPLAAGAGLSLGLPANFPRKTCTLPRGSPPLNRPHSVSRLPSFPLAAGAGLSPGPPANFCPLPANSPARLAPSHEDLPP